MPKPEPIWKTKGFESEYDYLSHLSKEKGFKSLEHEYTELWAIQRGFESAADRIKFLRESSGFSSTTDYQDYLARKKGFKSFVEYQQQQIKERGFKSTTDYQDYLAKKRGFKSYSDYYTQMRLKNLAKLKGFESYEEYQEHLVQIEKSIRAKKEEVLNRSACRFLTEKVSENVRPTKFVRKR